MALCVHIAYGCLEATTAQLGSRGTHCMPPKVYDKSRLAQHRKSLPVPVLGDSDAC